MDGEVVIDLYRRSAAASEAAITQLMLPPNVAFEGPPKWRPGLLRSDDISEYDNEISQVDQSPALLASLPG